MTEDGGKRVILKNSEGNKKAEAGKHIFSASKRDSLSALQYQNVKEALTMGQLEEPEEARQELEEEHRSPAQRHWTEP